MDCVPRAGGRFLAWGDGMNVLEARLAVQGVLILDGSLATELEARGFSVDDPLWSAKALFERPDLVSVWP